MRTAGQNRRRASERVCTVYTVLADSNSDLGDTVYRFRTRREAEAFAAGKDHWGAPATVDEDSEVPYRLALRWGVAS